MREIVLDLWESTEASTNESDGSIHLRMFPDILECVYNGDIEELKLRTETGFIDYFKNIENIHGRFREIFLFITGSLVTVSYMGGLPLEIGSKICTYYLRKSILIETIDDFLKLNLDILSEFTKEVFKYKKTVGVSSVDYCIQYINANLDKKIFINTLAAECGYSLSRMQHIFTAETGQSFTDYIKNEKLKKACFLLKYTDLSCLNISEKLAFSSQSWFAKEFKNKMGITPIQYRKKFRER